jgi:prepilin-type N-terminal cleavage/methylation domain-containing protein
MMIKTMHIADTQKGFSLLETMLALGLLAILLTGTYVQFDNWATKAINRQAAADMLRLQNAAEDYALANFSLLKSSPLGQLIEFDLTDLSNENYLPSGYRAVNAFNQPIRVFYRVTREPKKDINGVNLSPVVYVYRIEVMTASEGAGLGVAPVRLIDAARAGGPKMGVITNTITANGVIFSGNISSVFSEWSLPLTDFDTAITVSGAYTAAADAEGNGYLGSYGIVNLEDAEASDEWLYRTEISGRPELNRMETDLLMNNNRIENAGTIVVDRMNVTGNAAFLGETEGTKAMSVEQALRINGTAESRINMKTSTAGCSITVDGGGNRGVTGAGCAVEGGNFEVTSSGNADLTMERLLGAANLNTDRANFGTNPNPALRGATQSRGLSTFGSVTATQMMEVNEQVVTPATVVTGANTIAIPAAVHASNFQAQTLNAAQTSSANTLNVQNLSQRTAAGLEFEANTIDAEGSINATQTQTQNLTVSGKANIKKISNYTDTGAGPRTVVCTTQSGFTFCEPDGVRSVSTPAGNVTETCTRNPSGYICTSTGAKTGTCVYVRDSSTGKAKHTGGCT